MRFEAAQSVAKAGVLVALPALLRGANFFERGPSRSVVNAKS